MKSGSVTVSSPGAVGHLSERQKAGRFCGWAAPACTVSHMNLLEKVVFQHVENLVLITILQISSKNSTKNSVNSSSKDPSAWKSQKIKFHFEGPYF